MEQSLNKANIELINRPDEDLKHTLNQKMNELDELNKFLTLKSRQQMNESPEMPQKPLPQY